MRKYRLVIALATCALMQASFAGATPGPHINSVPIGSMVWALMVGFA